MKKKLLKYGKVLMALTLIGALTLPSYATVGAADGSAFVTKAEFDAALSDFNARLTTFEAGINSKIDSQVSSYLDRNGIWNGKSQELLGVVWEFNQITAGHQTSSNDQYMETVRDSGYRKKVINNINKSGLACIKFETNESSSSRTPTLNADKTAFVASTYYRYGWYFYWSMGGTGSSNGPFNIYQYFIFSQSASGKSSISEIKNDPNVVGINALQLTESNIGGNWVTSSWVPASYGRSTATSMYFYCCPIFNTVYYFVKSGKPLYISYAVGGYVMNGWWDIGTCNAGRWWVSSCTVY